MRTSTLRNTGREVTKVSFQLDVRDIDVVEKISKKRQVSLSDVLRECVRREVRMWR